MSDLSTNQRGRGEAPAGWTATWLPHDKQFSYLHVASDHVQFGYPNERTIAKYEAEYPYSLSPQVRSPALSVPSPYQAIVPNLPPRRNAVSGEGGGGGGQNGDSEEDNGEAILRQFDVEGNWSGKGQHVEFLKNEHIPLDEGISLGRGASADVHEVKCRGVRLARKQIFCSRRMKIEDVKRELDILKKLNHKHVVTLIGSYTQSRVLGLLLYPAAVCDLGVYLDELDEERKSGSEQRGAKLGEVMHKICERLGIQPDLQAATERLNRVYGCLANAVQYLHDNDVRHKDLKPRNILLDRDDGLFVTDFGLSRDTTDASTSVTSGIERGTYKYCAPEVANYEPRGRAADIYSLGCVYLEINTVYRRLSLVEFDLFRTENEDHSFQNNPEKLKQWMERLRPIATRMVDPGLFELMDLVERMVAVTPADRPVISQVITTLNTLGGQAYFAKCCGSPADLQWEYKQLAQKYRKVKVLYFDKMEQIEDLNKSLGLANLRIEMLEEEAENRA